MNLKELPISFDTLLAYATSGLLAVLILAVGWVVSKWARRIALRTARRSLNEAAARFLSGIAQYTVLAAAFIAALGEVGVETTSLVAIFASAGLAVGLALQGSLSHFSSGVMILLFRPFVLDDFVTIGGHTGTVKDVGVFATTLHTQDNQKIIIPNASITSNPIINSTALGTRRAAIDVGVAYGSDATEVMRILRDSADRIDTVLGDPEPGVAFVGLGASSIDFKVLVWCLSGDYIPTMGAVRQAIYEDLNAAGIDIPFNQIVVHRAEA